MTGSAPGISRFPDVQLHVGNDGELPQPPAYLSCKALVKLRVIGPFGRLPHALVQAEGVVADQNAPALGLDAIENDFGGSGGRRRRVLKKAAGAFGGERLNVLVRHS